MIMVIEPPFSHNHMANKKIVHLCDDKNFIANIRLYVRYYLKFVRNCGWFL